MKTKTAATGINSTFQIAEVSRPLYSVSKICDSGATVKFDSPEAIVRNKNGRVLVKFERQGGLYVAEFSINPKAKAASFTGQSHKA
jgi:hypothetical protein